MKQRIKRMNKNSELVRRAYNVEFKAIEGEENVIEGVPIVFEKPTRIIDSAGQFDEIIDRHALDNADLKDVALFVNHDMNKIALARTKNGHGTMSLEIMEDGLHIRAVLDLDNNSEAKTLYSAIKRGDIDGMSFAFRIKSQEWINIESDIPTRRITEVSIVHEVSVVNYPAYPQTSVNARNKDVETSYSALAEARKAYAEETELELWKEKNRSFNI